MTLIDANCYDDAQQMPLISSFKPMIMSLYLPFVLVICEFPGCSVTFYTDLFLLDCGFVLSRMV